MSTDLPLFTPKAPEPEEMSIEPSVFAEIGADYQRVLDALAKEDSAKMFRIEFEKLHEALKKSHENEKRLLTKCRTLNQELMSNASKVHTAMRLSQEDQTNIALLKKEVDKAWKMVDAAHEKEKRAKQTIFQLKVETQNLSRMIDQGAGLSIGQEHTVNELMEAKDKLQKSFEDAEQMVEQQKTVIESHTSIVEQLESQLKASERQEVILKEKLEKVRNEAERESRRALRLQEEMVGIKEISDRREKEVQRLSKELDASRDNNDQLKAEVKDGANSLERHRRLGHDMRMKNEEFERQIEEHVRQNHVIISDRQRALEDVTQMSEIVKKRDDTIALLRKKLTKAQRKEEQLSAEKHEADKVRDHLKGELSTFKKELDRHERATENDDKLIKELQVQVKKIALGLQASKEKNKANGDSIRVQKDAKKVLENDIRTHKQYEEKLQKDNHLLEVQNEKSSAVATSWSEKYQEAQDIVKMKEMEIVELQKKIQEEKAKLKMQQSLYETVRADRNLFSQQHIEAQDEIAEMKRKFKILTHQIDQLKEEIASKDQAIIQQHFQVKTLKEEMKTQRKLNGKKDAVLENAEQLLANQDTEVKTLRQTLLEADQNQREQKKVYEDVVSERDVLGAQMIRRNDELALLYEKSRIQEGILKKGEIQYQERLNEMRILKLKLNDLSRQLQVRNSAVSTVDALKQELHKLQRELLQERTKVKALSEEIENPLNVHRWRKLEGSDPKAFDLLQKIQTLQRRLILKTEAVVEKDLMIQEKDRLYLELKNILARQPGPEVAEQLCAYQQNVKEKTRQMKAMAAELNMLQAQVNEYKYEIERVTRELQDVKRKYYEQRRKDQLDKEGQRNEDVNPSDPLVKQHIEFLKSQPKFVGGGFNLVKYNAV